MTIGYTPYSRKNQNFTDKAHGSAQHLIYPPLFGVDPYRLTFHPLPPEQAMTLDADMGTDRFVQVQVDTFLAPIPYLVQERFRRAGKYKKYDDITITEWSYNTDKPAEFYKCKAGLFVYGKYDECSSSFTMALAVSWASMTCAIIRGELPYKRTLYPDKNQTFLAVKISDLERLRLILWKL